MTELRSTEEMALNLARAVQSVIDCDQSMVLVHDPSTGGLHVAATHGFAETLEHQLASVTLPASSAETLSSGVTFYPADRITQFGRDHGVALDDAAVAGASAPMVANDQLIGALVVFVSDRPERLRENPTLGEALRGLSGQAAVAIRNAQLVDQVRHQALHDALTGLPNRSLVLDRLDQALARTKRDGTVAAAMFIDLDGFKDVNDSLGHAAGDRLLVAVADRFRATVRGSDTLGRLGGDEFVVVAEGASLADGPQPIAERILEVMHTPFELQGIDSRLSVTASIGIAMGNREAAGELLRDADIALYHAKEQGKNCFILYEPEMSQRAADRMELEKQVRIATERQQLFLLYQPFFDLCTGRVIGAEALLRWRHPERGVVDAQEFVAVLEDVGLGVEVGQKVLAEATRQGSHWHQLGYPIDISVNVSRGQLESGHLANDIARGAVAFRVSRVVFRRRGRRVVASAATCRTCCWSSVASGSSGSGWPSTTSAPCHSSLASPEPVSGRRGQDRPLLHRADRRCRGRRRVDPRPGRAREGPRTPDPGRGHRDDRAGLPPPAGAVRRRPGVSAGEAAPGPRRSRSCSPPPAPLSQGPLQSGV